ncbi:MAG: LLM class flavin-dependent oxidoreductase [Chloroflexia bacterium]|nr:LLM class flavin-dependent oxidoreductase [Chloroflexia bacterium]
MKFTLDLSHHPWTRDQTGNASQTTLATARAADAAGIDAIWVSEDPEGWDAFATLGAIAAVTANAALGTSVTSPYPRHPNLLAASVATLDRLSGGRAVLGLGRGQAEWHRDALGVEIGDPLTALGETVDLLRAWWTPPHRATSPDDGHFEVNDWERVVHPAQDHVPIYLAAAGPRALELAGTRCDGAIFNALTSDDFLRDAIPRVRSAAAATGREPQGLVFVLRTAVVVAAAPDAERAALDRNKNLFCLVAALPGMDRLVRTGDFDVPVLLDSVRATMRTGETLAAGGGFPALRREGDLAAARALVPDDLIRRLGIIGPLDAVRERVRVLAELGITHIGVAPPPDLTSQDAWRSLLKDIAPTPGSAQSPSPCAQGEGLG